MVDITPILVGDRPNDGKGDLARDAWIKTNVNTQALAAAHEDVAAVVADLVVAVPKAGATIPLLAHGALPGGRFLAAYGDRQAVVVTPADLAAATGRAIGFLAADAATASRSTCARPAASPSRRGLGGGSRRLPHRRRPTDDRAAHERLGAAGRDDDRGDDRLGQPRGPGDRPGAPRDGRARRSPRRAAAGSDRGGARPAALSPRAARHTLAQPRADGPVAQPRRDALHGAAGRGRGRPCRPRSGHRPPAGRGRPGAAGPADERADLGRHAVAQRVARDALAARRRHALPLHPDAGSGPRAPRGGARGAPALARGRDARPPARPAGRARRPLAPAEPPRALA